MSSSVIILSSDVESEEDDVKDIKPILPINNNKNSRNSSTKFQSVPGDPYIKLEYEESRSSNCDSCASDQGSSSANGVCLASASPSSQLPLCRQFWKSGDYEVGQAPCPRSQSGRNRLRIHPRFLHSNATSHKWAFGAIAELLDNAVDEVQNGATNVIVEEFTNPRNETSCLLIQDDGGGMDCESLRRCMSFGFSEKQSGSSIGQYGNGFKTSTMRLGSDVIVFSRCLKRKVVTQSVGLLSYNFLMQTGCDDIVVPMVDYEFDRLTMSSKRVYQNGEKQFSSNLSIVLKWTPFKTEDELLKQREKTPSLQNVFGPLSHVQAHTPMEHVSEILGMILTTEQFDEIGEHGTRIIMFNLWLNDDGEMELDFYSDMKDIKIRGGNRKVHQKTLENLTNQYIANRLHYSLRAYTSILYLRLPENFKIVLRGQVVEPHNLVNDLIYPECILYRPQVGGKVEAPIMTTIGFLQGSPNINVHGFNTYHKNRLILPFWKVANNSYGKGRGVVGLLETNFVKPTHDKQDFEKSNLYQKLETRLKEMTYEYWDLHCHLVGYYNKKLPTASKSSGPESQISEPRTSNHIQAVEVNNSSTAASAYNSSPDAFSKSNLPSLQARTNMLTKGDARLQEKLPLKRKYEGQIVELESIKSPNSSASEVGYGTSSQMQHGLVIKENQRLEIEAMMLENKKLLEQCMEYENTEKQLMLKEEMLRRELQKAEELHQKLLAELEVTDGIKSEES